MSSSLESQSKTETLFDLQASKTIPAFGLHPWFTASISTTGELDKRTHYRTVLQSSGPSQKDRTHKKMNQPPKNSNQEDERDRSIEAWIDNHLDLLPTPISLDRLISDLKSRLIRYPNSILGEIGLDKAFRFQVNRPETGETRREGLEMGSEDHDRGGRILRTNFRISIDHQSIILKSQIELAIELSRSISLHCVQASNELIESIQRLIDEWGANFTGPTLKSKRQRDRECRSSITIDRLTDRDQEQTPTIDQNDPPQTSSHHPPHPRRGEGIKICWHSANISIEVLQRLRSLLPNTIYFSYSNDLSILCSSFKPDSNDDDHRLGLFDHPPVKLQDYSKRVVEMIRFTPIDRLLIESDDGSDPISIDRKLLRILTLIYLIKHPPSSPPAHPPIPPTHSLPHPHHHLYFKPTFLSLVDQIQSNWNAFYSLRH